MNILDQNIFSTSVDGSPQSRSLLAVDSSRINEPTRDFMQYGYDYFDNTANKLAYQGYSYDGRYSIVAQAISSYFELHDYSSIYEVGCAKGYLLYEFSRLGYQICGIDYSAYAVSHCHPGVLNHVLQGHASTFHHPSAHNVDLVICKETLPHLSPSEIQAALGLMTKVVRNPSNILLQIQYPKNIEDAGSIAQFDPTHKTLFSKEDWISLLQDSNFIGSVHFKPLF